MMTKITLLLKLFVYLLVFKFVFTLNAIYYYYYYHYTLFIVCAHFRLMFGFCCVAVSLLFHVAPSSVRFFSSSTSIHVLCWLFVHIHTPSCGALSLLHFFSHFFLFSLSRWRDGAGYWSPWGRVLWFDIELRLELSTTRPSQRWILGGGSARSKLRNFLRTWGDSQRCLTSMNRLQRITGNILKRALKKKERVSAPNDKTLRSTQFMDKQFQSVHRWRRKASKRVDLSLKRLC